MDAKAWLVKLQQEDHRGYSSIQDIDLDRRTINIDHQLQRTSEMQYIIVDSAKTDAGTRILPMEDDVHECFSRILAERKKPKVTLNTYTHLGLIDAEQELERMKKGSA